MRSDDGIVVRSGMKLSFLANEFERTSGHMFAGGKGLMPRDAERGPRRHEPRLQGTVSLRSLRAFLDRPPRILSVLAVAWLLLVLVQNSDAGVGIVGLFTMLYGGVAVGVVWIVRLVLFSRGRRGSDRQFSRLFLVPPAALLLALTAGFLDAPRGALFRIRFALSEDALTREAQALLSRPGQPDGPRRLGLFAVQRLTVHDGQVRFITTACGVVDSCGVVYSPNREPARWQEDTFTHLSGPWWHVYEGF